MAELNVNELNSFFMAEINLNDWTLFFFMAGLNVKRFIRLHSTLALFIIASVFLVRNLRLILIPYMFWYTLSYTPTRNSDAFWAQSSTQSYAIQCRLQCAIARAVEKIAVNAQYIFFENESCFRFKTSPRLFLTEQTNCSSVHRSYTERQLHKMNALALAMRWRTSKMTAEIVYNADQRGVGSKFEHEDTNIKGADTESDFWLIISSVPTPPPMRISLRSISDRRSIHSLWESVHKSISVHIQITFDWDWSQIGLTR